MNLLKVWGGWGGGGGTIRRVFWWFLGGGGVSGGFWSFGHRSTSYTFIHIISSPNHKFVRICESNIT